MHKLTPSFWYLFSPIMTEYLYVSYLLSSLSSLKVAIIFKSISYAHENMAQHLAEF